MIVNRKRFMQYLSLFDANKETISQGDTKTFTTGGYNYLIIGVSGVSAIQLSFKGALNLEHDLPITTLSGDSVQTITDNGIYIIPLYGLKTVTLSLTSFTGSPCIAGNFVKARRNAFANNGSPKDYDDLWTVDEEELETVAEEVLSVVK